MNCCERVCEILKIAYEFKSMLNDNSKEAKVKRNDLALKIIDKYANLRMSCEGVADVATPHIVALEHPGSSQIDRVINELERLKKEHNCECPPND
jgi:hypothetical protein